MVSVSSWRIYAELSLNNFSGGRSTKARCEVHGARSDSKKHDKRFIKGECVDVFGELSSNSSDGGTDKNVSNLNNQKVPRSSKKQIKTEGINRDFGRNA